MLHMNKNIVLFNLLMLILSGLSYAGKYYHLYAPYQSLQNVSYETYTDIRDNRNYKIYKAIKPFSIQCGDNKYCLDTAFVYLFAENSQYETPGSICHPDGCGEYGRYYPKIELDQVCPTGWSIPAADEANVGHYIIFNGDTIYGTHDRYIRVVHSNAFPDDGSEISDQYSLLDDFPSGWFDKKDRQFKNSGKIGTVWLRDDTDFYPVYINFGLLHYDSLNKMVQTGGMETEGNMYPVKCHRIVFKNKVDTTKIVPRTLGPGIYSMERVR